MCGCNSNCAKCASSSAEGTVQEFDPVEMSGYVNKYIFGDNPATDDQVKEAYVKAMLWIETKKLPFNENTIAENAEEIKVAINDPNYFDSIKVKRNPFSHSTYDEPNYINALILIAFVIAILLLLQKWMN